MAIEGQIPEIDKPSPETMAEALAEVNEAVKLINSAETLQENANRIASSAVLAFFMNRQPFKIELTYPDVGSDSHITHDDNVLVVKPTQFEATEITSLGHGGAEFIDRRNDQRLYVRGYNFKLLQLDEVVNGEAELEVQTMSPTFALQIVKGGLEEITSDLRKTASNVTLSSTYSKLEELIEIANDSLR